MKRQAFIRHLTVHGCELRREGSNHSIYWNPQNGNVSAVPRHNEIKPLTARKICRELGIPEPKKS